jgi:hypothetical protein
MTGDSGDRALLVRIDGKMDKVMDILSKHNGRISALEEADKNAAEFRKEMKTTLTGLATKEDLKEVEKAVLNKVADVDRRTKEKTDKVEKLGETTAIALEDRVGQLEKVQREQETLLTTWKAKISVVYIVAAGVVGIVAAAFGDVIKGWLN